MPLNATTLADLTSRQLSYGIAGIYRWVLPSDLLELGGELESRLHLQEGKVGRSRNSLLVDMT